MPGPVTRIRDPPRIFMSTCNVSCTITASVKSRFTSHQDGCSSSRRGTTQRPVRWKDPARWSIRITSSAGAVSGARLARVVARSAVSGASSRKVREDRAASMRSLNSSAVRRPSAVAARSTSMTRSRSASEALRSGELAGSGGSPVGGMSAGTSSPPFRSGPRVARRSTLAS